MSTLHKLMAATATFAGFRLAPKQAARNFFRWLHSLATAALTALFLLAATLTAFSHAPGVVLSGSGTATIDGVFNTTEWAGAGTITFAANLPEGGTTPATLYVMNNQVNLFLAIRFARPSLDFANSTFFDFD